MKRLLILAAMAMLAGCAANRSRLDDSLLARTNPFDDSNQVLFIPERPGSQSFATLFDQVLDVMDDTFEIAYSNRYDGRIESAPRIAPGYEQFFKAGSPDAAERALATLQTYRHRAFALIQPEENGYRVSVTVFKELEDLPGPSRDLGGGAAFRSDNNIDRTYEVVDPTVVSNAWIPKGRDRALEQKILRKIRLQIEGPPPRRR